MANKTSFKKGHKKIGGFIKGSKHTNEAKKRISENNKLRYSQGEKFGFQKGHKINLGKTFTKRGIYKICSVCQEKFYVALGASNRRVYCSKKCLFASSIYRNAISQRQKGKIVSEEVKEKLSLAFRGPKSFLWMGGKGLITKNLRQHPKYTQWRRRVVKKDGYKCVKCGSKSNLHADHIIPVVENPKLIFKVDNGRTLCGDCHTQITNEWRKSKKLAQTRTG